MKTADIRAAYLDFFARRGHDVVPSASLVPNDPTLLFTNAGMVQFKPYFQGEQTPPWRRAVTIQKCLRVGGKHNDIDEVGKTTRHLTFFEMLGNFSFGDYYKESACPWAWELATEAFGLDPEHLWVSVFPTDEEAFEIWRDKVGVRPERIVRLEEDFWSMGVAGPCGPCSEIHLDRGPDYGEASDRGPADNEERYVEFWNLVFMEDECNSAIEPVGELPTRNIDTGAGLERIAMILQNVDTVFDTDILAALIAKASQVTATTYGHDARADVALKILADHARSVAFAIGDGVLPSNQERGYVLRALMRRTVRHARLLGQEQSFLADLTAEVVSLMGDAYPELRARADLIADVCEREEARFGETLRQGLAMLENEIVSARDLGGGGIPGEVAFKLHDTFGFPIELTTEIAAEAGLGVERTRFDELMADQRARARAARTATGEELAEAMEVEPTEFLGYRTLHAPGRVVALSGGGPSPVPVATEGDEIVIVLDRTPFYAEGGGQVGDRGTIRGPSGVAQVIDTVRVAPGVFGHRSRIVAGEMSIGDDVDSNVDPQARHATERAHTATHILHWVLRDRLGEHATQAGSLVEPGRLRFDFHHFDAVGDDGLRSIGDEVGTLVMAGDPVDWFETTYDEAKALGAMAIFGEKYGDHVRVVEVGDYSKELCGGTHVARTGDIGVVVLTSEGSVGANLRRIEALVGHEGLAYIGRRLEVLDEAARLLRGTPDDVTARIERLLESQRELEHKLARIERQTAAREAESLAAAAEQVDGVSLVVARRDGEVDVLRSLVQDLKGRLPSAVVVMGTAGQDRANLVAAVSKDVVERGVSARDVLAPGARLLGGGAGGKPDLAISGGPAADKIDEALAAVGAEARNLLGR